MTPEVCTAIRQRRRLRFNYAGGQRLVEPYAYGASETQELLRAYQVSGFSAPRQTGWKLFRVEEISDLAMLDDVFRDPQAGYMRNDPCLEVAYCEI